MKHFIFKKIILTLTLGLPKISILPNIHATVMISNNPITSNDVTAEKLSTR